MKQCISFFSNAGIGDIGVEMAGVHVVHANELLPKRAETYLLNHPQTNVMCRDINTIEKEDVSMMKETLEEDLFLLVATPPCQGVSAAGKRDPFDIRNQLIKPTVKMIKEFRPRWVWLENVPNYEKATIPDTPDIVEDKDDCERIDVLGFLRKELAPFGYRIEHRVLNANQYGVPQSRKRLIIIMTRTAAEITFPEPTHGIEGNPFATVRDAIGQLEPLESGEASKHDPYHFAARHNENHVKWMKATPEGQTAFDNERFEDRPHVRDKNSGILREIKAFKTTYKRIWWDRPSPTVTMGSAGISSQNNVHPRDSRALTLREVMLLQSIPMWYTFSETTIKERREMVGEAVPPLLAKAITEHIIGLDEMVSPLLESVHAT